MMLAPTVFDGMVAQWPRKMESWATPPCQVANSFMTSWRVSNPKCSCLGAGGPVPGADLYIFSH